MRPRRHPRWRSDPRVPLRALSPRPVTVHAESESARRSSGSTSAGRCDLTHTRSSWTAERKDADEDYPVAPSVDAQWHAARDIDAPPLALGDERVVCQGCRRALVWDSPPPHRRPAPRIVVERSIRRNAEFCDAHNYLVQPPERPQVGDPNALRRLVSIVTGTAGPSGFR